MKYKVGDKVKVREDLKVGKRYNMADKSADDIFTIDMSKFKGQVVIISKIKAGGTYEIDVDKNYVKYAWVDEMFEPVEFTRRFKVGDKVRIVSEKTGARWNWRGKMDKWLGKVMTIREVTDKYYRMEEDKTEFVGEGWFWYDEMIAGLADQKKIVITTDGKTTLARLYEGSKVIKSTEAKCSPDDAFDFKKGAEIAFDRLFEEKKSELYNGKVICIDNIGNPTEYTTGKIYEFKDGMLTTNAGDKLPYGGVRSFKEWTNFSCSKWLEVVE